jgi:hypothetical protein
MRRLPRQSPLLHWSARPKSALALSSSECCDRSIRSLWRGSLRRCIRSAQRSSSCWVSLGHRIRAVARCRQRHDHDHQGHFAVGIVWTPRIRPAQRVAVRPGSEAASSLAVFVWLASRSGGNPGGRLIGWTLPRSLRLAVFASSAPVTSGRTLHRYAAKHCRHFLALVTLFGRAKPRQHRAISWSLRASERSQKMSSD